MYRGAFEAGGRVWHYTAEARNRAALGQTDEQNAAGGLLLEGVLDDCLVAAGGRSQAQLEDGLRRTVLAYLEEGEPVPRRPRRTLRSLLRDAWCRLRMGLLVRRWRREGTLQPVTRETWERLLRR